MTKEEAIEALEKGNRIQHSSNFYPGEWVKMDEDGFIVTEEGYKISFSEFWSYRDSVEWEQGWEIIMG